MNSIRSGYWAEGVRYQAYMLEQLQASPVIYLNKTLAGGKFEGPEGESVDAVDWSLVAACAEQWDIARQFAEQAVVAADWALDNGSLQVPPAARFWPGNWARATRSKAYARWMLEYGLDRAALGEAARKASEWVEFRHIPNGGLRDDATAMWYTQAVRMSLIAADLPLSRELLGRHKLQRGFLRQQKLYQRLIDEHPLCLPAKPVEALGLSETVKAKPAAKLMAKPARKSRAKPQPPKNAGITPQLRLDVEELFELVRPADFKYDALKCVDDVSQLRFELALIRQLYLVQSDPRTDPTPQAVITAITS